MIKECDDITEGIIKEDCNFQINAISEGDMKALLKAHLKQDHNDEFVELEADKIAELDDRIEAIFESD